MHTVSPHLCPLLSAVPTEWRVEKIVILTGIFSSIVPCVFCEGNPALVTDLVKTCSHLWMGVRFKTGFILEGMEGKKLVWVLKRSKNRAQ